MKIPKLIKKFRSPHLTFDAAVRLGVWVLGISFLSVIVAAGLVYYWYPGTTETGSRGVFVAKQFGESDFQALVQLLNEREATFVSSSTPLAVPSAFR